LLEFFKRGVIGKVSLVQRPQIMLNVWYNIIIKVLANRMKDLVARIVRPKKTRFVKERNILNDLIVV